MPAFKTRTVADVMALPEPNWIVRDILEQEGLTMLVGPPGAFKTFLALEVAMSVGAARERLFDTALNPDLFKINEYRDPELHKNVPNEVVYLAAEGQGFLKYRLEAWMRYYSIWTPQIRDSVRFILEPVPLWEKMGAKNPTVNDMIEAATGGSVVVIDTLARATAGLNENAAEDMGAFISAIDRIRSHGKSVIVVHHTTKDASRYRGSSALEGAADTILNVSHDKGTGLVKLSWEKQKNAAPRGPTYLSITDVPFGRYSSTGEEISSIVLQPVPPSTAALVGAGVSLGKTETSMFEMLTEVKYTTEGDLRAVLGNNWKRTAESLAEKGLIERNSDGTWSVVTVDKL